MKREEVLKRLGFSVPEGKKKRVIIDSDIKNEADDQFAIMHHLLTPSEDIRGIIATHFEAVSRIREKQSGQADPDRGKTMEKSFAEGEKILGLAEIDDVPLLHGNVYELQDLENIPDCEGADFIIAEAKKEDSRPLYVCVLGAITNVATALLKAPETASRLVIIWIGGGDYPSGGQEFNMMQDVKAAQVVFDSDAEVWQVPRNVYKTIETSFAELVSRIAPCGKIGAYLVEQMLEKNEQVCTMNPDHEWPHGESWSLGDNPTVSVLLMSRQRDCYHTERAPRIQEDLSYAANPDGKEIRVYDSVDVRLTYEDMIAKLSLCYRGQ